MERLSKGERLLIAASLFLLAALVNVATFTGPPQLPGFYWSQVLPTLHRWILPSPGEI